MLPQKCLYIKKKQNATILEWETILILLLLLLFIHSKYFSDFWSAITCTIHHNQLLLTEFRRILSYCSDDVKMQPKLQIIEPLTKKTWGLGWVVLVVRTKWRKYEQNILLISQQTTSKNIARRQLDGWHLLFGVYLQTWTTLYLLNFPINMHYWRW